MNEIRFVVLRGMFGIGISAFIVSSLIDYLLRDRRIDLISNLAISLLAGLLTGVFLWRRRSREEFRQTEQA